MTEEIDIWAKIKELRKDYMIDRTEFGKVLFIVSATLFVVSAHTVFTVGETADMAEESQEELRGASLIVGSERFQQTMESLDDRGMTVDGRPIDEVMQEMVFVEEASDNFDDVYDNLDHTVRVHQWLTFLGLVGMVGGLTVIYI